ncbi:MAG: ribosome biogenesis GTPase A [Granulosicoccus sp.]|jgi:ribosome biogenesis GTPase A
MSINWFPGHMHKARKEMAKVLPEIDVILEVIDARIPWSSVNPMLAEIAKHKPVLRVLTKSDLADKERTDEWLEFFSHDDQRDALAISTKNPARYKEIPVRLKGLVTATVKPRLKPRVAMVVGIPNVGKSTLINKLTGKVVAKTGNEPAITKRQQLIVLNDTWNLRDTPGVLWPKVENQASGFRLAATGAIRDTAMDSADVASHLLDHLCADYGSALRKRYGEDLPLADSVEALEFIGKKRGCIGGGRMVDFDRAGRLLLQEFREGLLGGITLETPAMRSREIKETEERLANLAEKKEARKERKSKERAVNRAQKNNDKRS